MWIKKKKFAGHPICEQPLHIRDLYLNYHESKQTNPQMQGKATPMNPNVQTCLHVKIYSCCYSRHDNA